jgi:hypothetical protein
MYKGISIGACWSIEWYFASRLSLSADPGAYAFTGSFLATGTLKIAFDIKNNFLQK